jgi:very-long-chain (3R)-3-hydroxyacyl-CoA dehydratase
MDLDGSCYFEFMTIVAWCIADMIRYANYFSEHPILVWLRYSAFIILYPVGVAGEWLNVYCKWDVISQCCPRVFSIAMPNALNFAFDYRWFILYVAIPGYVLGFPQLYGYMLSQRKRKLKPKTE